MIYYALVIGRGEGCDYTIGCNKTFLKLNVTTDEEAIEEIKAEMREHSWGEERVKSIKILKVDSILDFDVQYLFSEQKQKEREEKARLQKQKDKALYEQLKKQFENE